jgi:acetyl-CoA carboxylase biotin carboxyl carrier protein
MNLTNDDVQEILRLMDASSFDEMQIETDRFKLTLRRGAHSGWTEERQTLGNAAQVAQTLASSSAEPAVVLEPGMVAVHPPLVGTFYRAPKPGAPPFVEVGSHVEEDTVVAIVETMKLMNSVRAGVRGTVVKICAQNAAFVEQDAVLMILRAET